MAPLTGMHQAQRTSEEAGYEADNAKAILGCRPTLHRLGRGGRPRPRLPVARPTHANPRGRRLGQSERHDGRPHHRGYGDLLATLLACSRRWWGTLAVVVLCLLGALFVFGGLGEAFAPRTPFVPR